MNKPHSSSTTAFGFISVREIQGIGYCGGLLVVSQIGRPLEFHCSAPVAVNRAQKILYGKTYEKYLYCEQIGLSLINKSKKQPALFIADRAQLLDLTDMVETPVVALDHQEVSTRIAAKRQKSKSAHFQYFEIDEQKFWFTDDYPGESLRIRSIAESFTKSLSYDEPFERIQKAIEEAQAVAR